MLFLYINNQPSRVAQTVKTVPVVSTVHSYIVGLLLTMVTMATSVAMASVDIVKTCGLG